MRSRRLWAVLLFLSSTLSAQTASPLLYNGLSWRLIGPFRGGRAVAVSGVANGGATFYFGAVDGGIWKTTDAGTIWSPISDSDIPVGSIGALEVAPSNPSILYAGTGESDIRSDLASGDGIYKSTDSGATWANIGLHETRQISRIAIDPRDPDNVFIAALGHAYAPNEERGVFRSKDGGKTWRKVLYRGPQVGAADVALAPDNPRILLAAMWEAHRPPWSTYAPIGGPGSGLFRSTDGGDTWMQLQGHGLPGGEWGRVGVAIANGTQGKRMYAIVSAKAEDSGLYRSDDGGDTWNLINKDSRLTSRAWYFNCITVDPSNPDVVYDPNVALYKLSDGGKTLTIVRGAPGGDDYHQLWIDSSNSLHMVLGTDQGTTVTLDGGVTWSTWYNQPTAQFYHVITDNEFPYNVYGSQQDSGTAAVASRTDRGEIDSRDWFTVGGSESGYIAPDPKNSAIFYSSGTYGTVARFDRRMMQSQNIAPLPFAEFMKPVFERKYRDPWTPVLVFSLAQPNALYLGTQYVMRTLDGGLHWQTISPDLTGAASTGVDKKATATVDNAKRLGYGVVYTIAPSPLSANQIWAGSDAGLIHLTRDAGKNWTDVSPPGVADWSKITQIEASHFNAGEAYAAVDRHRLDDMAPYLYRTRDFGKTWQGIVDGIAPNAFLNTIREDPKCKGLLFAGTEFGVYVSFDDGAHWSPLQLNLPISSVRDLAIHGDDLIAATHGRAFWILDDISPLRQIATRAANQGDFLYAPARAIRMTSDNFSGTPLPPEEPQAQNPPRGAYIDYYLEKRAQSAIALEIVDAQNRVVRQFSSTDKPKPVDTDMPIAARWLPKQQALSTEPGMHRFVWDLRYGRTGERGESDSDDDDGPGRWLGPLVLPGNYRVRLTIDSETFTQLLTVTMDPRARITPAELAVQFNWSQRAFEDMIKARMAVAEIHGIETAITKLKQPDNSPLTSELKSATAEVGHILEGDPNHEGGLEETTHSLTATLNALQSADRTPPSQVIALYLEAAKSLKTELASWTDFKKQRLPALNERLRSAGLEPVQLSEIEEEAEESIAR